MLYVLNLLDVTVNFPVVATILINNSNSSLHIMRMCDMICPLTKFHVRGCNYLLIILYVPELNKILARLSCYYLQQKTVSFKSNETPT